MKKYFFRENFTAFFKNQDQIIRGKLAFKTHDTLWVNTEHPVIVLVSIHSAIHKNIDGDLKMNAFISSIKKLVKGKITVLLSDRAHLQTYSLKYHDGIEKAFERCLISAHTLKERYQPYFETCEVVYWHSYIYQDKTFLPSLKFIQRLFKHDSSFREHLLQDAENSFTIERIHMFASKEQFIEKAAEDLLEQCACVLVLSEKGYRFQFYPGRPNASTIYLNDTVIPHEKKVSWVNVFLSIENKTLVQESETTALKSSTSSYLIACLGDAITPG
ncbi:MAG: hypothetical protein H0T62_05920 [Parachlamydiaceae bacterium]|nr:hypothetical protein [Parachlamydiaceae bacterium]